MAKSIFSADPFEAVLAESNAAAQRQSEEADRIAREMLNRPASFSDGGDYGTPASTTRPRGVLTPQLRSLFEQSARKYGVPVDMLMALGEQESAFDPRATGVNTQWGKAKGIMQYLDSTARGMGIDPYNPAQAIDAAARQFRQRLDKGYSATEAVSAHFAGDNRAMWGPKTRRYGMEVMDRARRFRGMASQSSAPAVDPSDFAPENAPEMQERKPIVRRFAQGQVPDQIDVGQPAAGEASDQPRRTITRRLPLPWEKQDAASPNALALQEAITAQESIAPEVAPPEAEASTPEGMAGADGPQDQPITVTARKHGEPRRTATVQEPRQTEPTERPASALDSSEVETEASLSRQIDRQRIALWEKSVLAGKTYAQALEADKALVDADPKGRTAVGITPQQYASIRADLAKGVRKPGQALFTADRATGQKDVAKPTNMVEAAIRGVHRSALQLDNAVIGLTALGADLVGADDFSQTLLNVANENDTKIALTTPAGIQKLSDVHGLGDAGMLAAETMGEFLPQIVTGIGAGAVGKAAANALAKRSVAKFIEKKVAAGATREVAEQEALAWAKKVAARGAVAGAGSWSMAQEAGTIYKDTARETGERAPWMSLFAGIAAGSLDALEPLQALSRMGGGHVADEIVDGLVKRIGKEAARQTLLEGIPEAAQEFIEALPAAVIKGESPFTQEMLDNMLFAFTKGAIGGAGVGVVSEAGGAGVDALRERSAQKADDAAFADRADAYAVATSIPGDGNTVIDPAIAARLRPGAQAQRFAEDGAVGRPSDGQGFASKMAARKALNDLGLAETHEIVAATSVDPNATSGFLLRPKEGTEAPAATEAAPAAEAGTETTPQDAVPASMEQEAAPEAPTPETAQAPVQTAAQPEAPAGQSVTLRIGDFESSATVTGQDDTHVFVRDEDGAELAIPHADIADGQVTITPTAQADNPVSGLSEAPEPEAPKGPLGRALATVQPVQAPEPVGIPSEPAAASGAAAAAEAAPVAINVATPEPGNGQLEGGDLPAGAQESAPPVEAPVAEPTAARDVRGEAIDHEWTRFHPDSGALNIPRAEMPQIKAEHRGAMVNFLNARGIEHEEATVPAADLKPTQAEFSEAKVQKARDFEGGDRAILISSDNHVVDGHHQWMAARDKGEDIRAIRLKAPIREVLDQAHAFPSSTTADGATNAEQAATQEPETITEGSDQSPQSETEIRTNEPKKGGDQPTASKPNQTAKPRKPAAREAPKTESAPSDQTNDRGDEPTASIEDFGEELAGARKHTWQGTRDRLAKATELDTKAEPLSKSWPEPDYQKLIDEGADPYVVAAMRAMRDAIPNKPRSYGVASWAKMVEALRDTAIRMLEDGGIADTFMQKLQGDFSRSLRDLQGAIDLYMEFGHARSFKGISFSENHYSLYRGERNVTKWAIEQKQKATAFSNWPRELAIGDTREEVLDTFRKLLSAGVLDKKRNDTVRFDIYSYRTKDGFWIGKKVGKHYIDLKHFETSKEARDYKVEHYDDLVAELAKRKDIPPERKEVNSPRIGINHRNGMDVTPEQFGEAFGFRGVQFGNYVEGPRRQEDLNEAYDALMDLAGVLGVPPKALSLNGSLGLAFGARGKGGKNPASAHFESGNVVINLTKKRGAGSLAHEWWHSLDNYFARQRGNGDFVTETTARPAGNMRPEMAEAFKNVMAAIRQTALKERSNNLDKTRTKDYWSTDIEMSARAFESYVIAKLEDEQFSNDYLANIVSPEAFALEDGYPYLTAAEIPAVRAGFDAFFQTVETEASDKGVRMFSRSEVNEPVATLTGEELGDARDILDLEKRARAWFKNNLRGVSVTSSDGANVKFTRVGEAKIRGGERIFKAVPAIPAIIENGSYEGPLAPTAKWAEKGVVSAHRYTGAVSIGGKAHTYGVLVQEFADGRRFYYLTDQPEESTGSRLSLTDGRQKPEPALEVTPGAAINLFLLDNEGKANDTVRADAQPDADTQARVESIRKDMYAALRQMGLAEKVALRIVDGMLARTGAQGSFDAATRLIKVALDAKDSHTFVLGHEAIHALKEMGAFRPEDWALLEVEVRKRGPMLAKIRKTYPELNEAGHIEEGVANLFGLYLDGRYKPATTWVGVLMDRIRQTMQAIRAVFSKPQARDWRAVFEDAARGKLAMQAGGSEAAAIRYSKPEDHAGVTDRDRAALRAFLEGEPVVALTGEEFPKDGFPLTAKVAKWYRDNGHATVETPGIGVVALDQRAVKDSVSHGLGRDKAAAFAAVPEVLRNGRIIHSEPMRGSDHGMVHHVAAPISMGGSAYVMDVLVKADKGSRRMYVHEVALTEKLRQDAFKTEALTTENGALNGAPAGAIRSILQSIFAINPDGTSKVYEGEALPERYPEGRADEPPAGISPAEPETSVEQNPTPVNRQGRDGRAILSPRPDTKYSRPFTADILGHDPVWDDEVDRATPGIIDKIMAQANKAIKDPIGNLIEKSIATVPLHVLLDEWGPAHGLTAGRDYLATVRAMNTLRNKLHVRSGETMDKWRKFATVLNADHKVLNKRLMNLMHDSTIAQVDPSEAFAPLASQHDRDMVEAGTVGSEAAAERIARDEQRREDYARLKAKWDTLPPEAQAIYREVRDSYKAQSDAFDEALIANLAKANDLRVEQASREHDAEVARIDADRTLSATDKQEARDKAARRLASVKQKQSYARNTRLIRLRQQFESNRLEGPYFPLKRFGDFYVTSRNPDGTVASFSRFESKTEQQTFIKEQKAQGMTTEHGVISKGGSMRRQVDAGFVTDIESILDGSDVGDFVKDAIWQRWLETMPDGSIRKSGLHRKGTPGYSADALRAFSHHMFHGGIQLARLTHSVDLAAHLDAMQRQADDLNDNRAGQIVNETAKRNDFINNPVGGAFAQKVSTAAFMWMLAARPSAALVNLTQTVMVGIPVLAAYRKGLGATAAVSVELNKALVDFTRGYGRAERSGGVTAEERTALQQAYDSGLIDKTQAHDLAGMSEQPSDSGTGVGATIVRGFENLASWGFHHGERLNREVTFLAAYRLARKKGESHAQATETASKLTWATHFDYSSAAKPRIMQNDFGKATLVFRTFTLNMLWRGAMDFRTATAKKGVTAADKAAARARFAGMSGMMLIGAGITGTWGWGLLSTLYSIAMGWFAPDDDDDLEQRLRRDLEATIGARATNILMEGVPSAVTGINISSRIGMPDLWFRSPDRELEGQEEADYWMLQMGGASVSVFENIWRGSRIIMEGETERGVETMAPAFIKDQLKLARVANEGVKTIGGDTVMAREEMGAGDLIATSLGFTPTEMARRYDTKNAITRQQKRISDERKRIMDVFEKAAREDDPDKRDRLTGEAWDKAAAFNQKHPGKQITQKSVKQSLKSRERYDSNRVFGTYLDPKLREDVGRGLPASVFGDESPYAIYGDAMAE
jgi:hypothetical protein